MHIVDAFRNRAIHRALNHRFKRRAAQNCLRHGMMLPRERFTISRYRAAQVMHRHRPVATIEDFIFPRPHHFYCAPWNLFGDIGSVHHIITGASAATKTAARIECMNIYLLGFYARSSSNLLLIHCRHLAGIPEFTAIFFGFYHTVQRLNRRVREVGQFILRANHTVRFGKRRSGITCGFYYRTGFIGGVVTGFK